MVLAISFVVGAVALLVERRSGDVGPLRWLTLFGPPVLLLLAALTIAKDWRLRTERARVWANLAIWFGVGIVAALLTWVAMETIRPQFEAALEGTGGGATPR